MYNIKIDQDEVFTCKLKVEGTSLKKAFARIILETNRCNLLYKGTIDKNGNCEVKLSGLGNLLEEGDSGEIKFEVIAEDVYFSPWKDEFDLKKSKSLVAENINFGKIKKINKPKLQMKFPIDKKGITEYLSLIKNTFTSIENLNENKHKLNKIIIELSNKYELSDKIKTNLINATIRILK